MKLIVKKFYARFYAATIATFCCTSIESLHYTQMKKSIQPYSLVIFHFPGKTHDISQVVAVVSVDDRST